MNYNQISASVKDMASRAKSKGLKGMKWKVLLSLFLTLVCLESKPLLRLLTNQFCILSVGAIIENQWLKRSNRGRKYYETFFSL